MRSTRVLPKQIQRRSWRASLGRWLVPVAVVAGLAVVSANPYLTLMCLAVFSTLMALVWRPGEPPVLAFAIGFQWLQVSTKVFHADILDIPVASMFPVRGGDRAIWLSLAGLVVLGLGARFGILKLRTGRRVDFLRELRALSERKLFAAYLLAFVVQLVGGRLVWYVPGLSQILLSVLNLKWFFFFLFVFVALVLKRSVIPVFFAVALEASIGFTGFFSEFKTVFVVFLVGYLTVRSKPTLRNFRDVTAIVVLLFALAVVWMAVRSDYRQLVSGGERAQVIRLEFLERTRSMIGMLQDLDRVRLSEAAEDLAERISYVDYFARVLMRVPAVIPHEQGRLWMNAILHMARPRILFPNKPILASDSELTMKYAGGRLSSTEEGTSISMGYFVESYIDFGPIGMMFPIFLVGLAWGLAYRFFLTRLTWRGYAFAGVSAVLIHANQFEMHNVKLVGSLLMDFLVTAVFIQWVLPVFVRKFLRRRVVPGITMMRSPLERTRTTPRRRAVQP